MVSSLHPTSAKTRHFPVRMMRRLTIWIAQQRKPLVGSFALVIPACAALIHFSAPRFLAHILAIVVGVSGIYLGVALIYLTRDEGQRAQPSALRQLWQWGPGLLALGVLQFLVSLASFLRLVVLGH